MSATPFPFTGRPVRPLDLLRIMRQLRPEATEKLDEMFRRLPAHELGMYEFLAEVRQNVDETLLLEASLVFRGSSKPNIRDRVGARQLLSHGYWCRTSGCGVQGCVEIRAMLASLKAHSQSCIVGGTCRTCHKWARICEQQHACPPSAVLCRETTARRAFPSKLGNQLKGDGLLMLARYALGELDRNSPRVSPVNSPLTSPNGMRRKRSKVMSPTPFVQETRVDSVSSPSCLRAHPISPEKPMMHHLSE